MYTTAVSTHGLIIHAWFIVILNDKPVNGHKRCVHKYSSHENSREIDDEKQNKSRVQKKRTATETGPSFSPLI